MITTQTILRWCGENYLPTASFRFDKFHTYKAVTVACCGDMKIRHLVINAIKNKHIKTIKIEFAAIRFNNINKKDKNIIDDSRSKNMPSITT